MMQTCDVYNRKGSDIDEKRRLVPCRVRGCKSRGGDSNIKMPGCVCLVSENRPILNDTLSCKIYPY